MKKEGATKANSLSDPETWVDLYGDYLYRFALSRIRDATTAQDMVQETFLAALQNRENFKKRSSERTWLTSILKHKMIDHIRRASREQPTLDGNSDLAAIDELFDQKGGWGIKPAKWHVDPVKLLEQKEFWEVFSRCLEGLPSRAAHAFKLREMEGLGCEEICKVLGISASNCWIILYRARMLLRRCLEISWLGTNKNEDP